MLGHDFCIQKRPKAATQSSKGFSTTGGPGLEGRFGRHSGPRPGSSMLTPQRATTFVPQHPLVFSKCSLLFFVSQIASRFLKTTCWRVQLGDSLWTNTILAAQQQSIAKRNVWTTSLLCQNQLMFRSPTNCIPQKSEGRFKSTATPPTRYICLLTYCSFLFLIFKMWCGSASFKLWMIGKVAIEFPKHSDHQKKLWRSGKGERMGTS